MGFHKDAVSIFAMSLIFLSFVSFVSTGFNSISIDGWRHLSSAENIYLGRGYVVDTLWPLNEGLKDLPQKEFVSQPLYPFLVSLAFMAFGLSFKAAAAVNIIVESLNSVLTSMMAFEFTKSRKYSLLAGILYATNIYVMGRVVNYLTESLFTLFSLIAFLLLLRKRSGNNSILLGACVGLAFLTRMQAILLLLSVIYFLAGQNGRKAAKSIAVVIAAAALVASPSLLRNWSEKGNPFYTPSQYAILLPYPAKNYQSSMNTPSTAEIISRINAENMLVWIENVKRMLSAMVLDLGSVFAFFLMLAGLTGWLKFRKDHLLLIRTGFLYFAVTFLIIVTSYVQDRYLQFTIPLMTALAAVGLKKTFQFADMEKSPLQYYVIGTIVVMTVAAGIMDANNRTPHVAAMGSIWLSGKTTPNDVIMGDWPYHADYILKVKAVQTPSQKEYLKPMIDRYNVTYVIYLPKFDYGVIDGSESYLALVHENPKAGYQVYRVLR